jgi:hypothetical protein
MKKVQVHAYMWIGSLFRVKGRCLIVCVTLMYGLDYGTNATSYHKVLCSNIINLDGLSVAIGEALAR